jgi:hypothetical protein
MSRTLRRSIQPVLICCVVASVLTLSCRSSPALDPKNELPFGWIDAPVQGATVAPDSALRVIGWALDDSSVKEVRVYLDNHFSAKASFAIARADLVPLYPNYVHNSNTHGWRADIRTPASPGVHTLMAQATDDAGATHDLTVVSITVRGDAARP